MVAAPLAPIRASADAVTPSSGNSYTITNLGTGHVLDDFDSSLTDNNPILATTAGDNRSNQIWNFLTYPSTSGQTVFTLQAQSTSQGEPSFDGRAGFLRVDSTGSKIVQGGAPQAWVLTEVAPSVFKLNPFDSVFSNNGRLMLTDVNPTTDSSTPTNNQGGLQIDIESLEQFWQFS